MSAPQGRKAAVISRAVCFICKNPATSVFSSSRPGSVTDQTNRSEGIMRFDVSEEVWVVRYACSAHARQVEIQLCDELGWSTSDLPDAALATEVRSHVLNGGAPSDITTTV